MSKKRHYTFRRTRPKVRPGKPTPFEAEWPGWKCALIGFLTCEGRTSKEIAEILNDGTGDATIRRQWKRWRLPVTEGRKGKMRVVPAFIKAPLMRSITADADKRGMSPGRWVGRVAEVAARDNMFDAIVDEGAE